MPAPHMLAAIGRLSTRHRMIQLLYRKDSVVNRAAWRLSFYLTVDLVELD